MSEEKARSYFEENCMWYTIANKCLEIAEEKLKSETAPTAATIETVQRLIDIAVKMDEVNYRWSVKPNNYFRF